MKTETIRVAYKYRLYPTDEQKETLNQWFGVRRFVYNAGIDLQKYNYEMWKRNEHLYKHLNETLPKNERYTGFLSAFSMSYQLTEAKKDIQWLNDCPAAPQLAALADLEKTFKALFNGGGYPRYRSNKGKQSITFDTNMKSFKPDFKGGTINVPRMGKVNVLYHRTFEGQIKVVTISRTTTDKFFISFSLDTGTPVPQPKVGEKVIGIDLGLSAFLYTSEGESVPAPKFLRNALSDLRKAQRKLARQKEARRRDKRGVSPGTNEMKQKLVVAKLHETVKHRRENFLHEVSTRLINEYDVIVLETLSVKNMVKNRKLAMSIADAGWSTFVQMLEYKAKERGKMIIKIDRWFPSTQTCSNCGKVKEHKEKLALKDRVFKCECGHEMDRDLNAAINIRKEGEKIIQEKFVS